MDNVPWLLKPWFALYGYGFGLLQFVYFCIVHLTCRIEHEGGESLSPDRNYIYCLWHGDLHAYFCVFLRHRRHAWMSHPTWNMKPIHISIRLAGIDRIFLGSSGHGGRAAAEQVVRALRNGNSTALAPAGPAGPARTLKSGLFHMAAQSGVPIVPLRFQLSRCWEMPSWDRKRFPKPFSRARIESRLAVESSLEISR